LAARRKFSGPADARIERALCIAAHPDDLDFFAAGTVLLMTRRGVAVDLVVATSGDKGSRDGATSGADLAATREGEQLASAELLGVGSVEYLRHRDAELVDSLELRRELVREIRRSRPDVLLAFDPTPGYRQHPDHRVIGRVAMDAAWPCARDPLTYPEMGPPHETAEAWLFGGPSGARIDLEIDVSEVLDVKIRARLEHRSQTSDPAALRRRWYRVGRQERFAQVDLR
jgi:LmbE family N-acetylglucosaminyl deacetylase